MDTAYNLQNRVQYYACIIHIDSNFFWHEDCGNISIVIIIHTILLAGPLVCGLPSDGWMAIMSQLYTYLVQCMSGSAHLGKSYVVFHR